MITFDAYADAMASLAHDGWTSRPLQALRSCAPEGIYIKHDVEASPGRAVKLARIEASYGHRATYFFQADFLDTIAGEQSIRTIGELGHEVAYHYDVMDANNGDHASALAQFADYLDRFKKLGFSIKTVCPHGNPTKIRHGWKSNKDFFRSAEVRQAFPDIMDVVVQFPSLFPQGVYISDAGLRLRRIGQIAANDTTRDSAMNDGVDIHWDHLSGLAKRHEGVVISIHPHRLMNSHLSLKFQRGVFSALKKCYVIFGRFPLVSSVSSRFYTLSRRI